MNTDCIRFQSAKCRARMKAPLQLGGRNRNCPGCDQVLTVPRLMPQDAGPVLVLLEGEERFALGVRRRPAANYS